MRATAAIVAEADPGRPGGARLTTLRSDPPLTVRPTPGGVHLVGSTAGPLGGDVLALDVMVGAGAALAVRSAAATLAQPGARGGASHLRVAATVEPAAALRWSPEPLVLVRGCDHRAAVALDLAEGAAVVWRDDVVLGRHGEPSGSLRARLRVDRAGRPLLRNDLVVGPRWPGSQGPAGVGRDTRAVTTVLIVGPLAEVVADGPLDLGLGAVRAAVARLAPDAVLLTAVGDRAGASVAAVDRWLAGLRRTFETVASDRPAEPGARCVPWPDPPGGPRSVAAGPGEVRARRPGPAADRVRR